MSAPVTETAAEQKLPLIDQIKQNSIAARKAAVGKPKDSVEQVTAKSYAGILAGIQNAAIEAKTTEMSDAKVLTALGKSLETVRQAFASGATGDYAAALAIEQKIIEAYIPAMLSDDEVQNRVMSIASAFGRPLEMKDIKDIKAKLDEEIPGQFNPKSVSTIVKQIVADQQA